jgi:SPP1 family predicted phage head-tail adaptor
MPLRRISAGLPRPGQSVALGAFNRQITFYAPAVRNPVDNSMGSPSAAFRCWAALFALAGDELDKAQQIAQRVTHLVMIQYAQGVEESMTIQYQDGGSARNFQIAAIEDPDEMRVQLKIYCFEIGTNAGGAS